MAYQETTKEKEKREAYMKANKERGVRAEKQKEYEMFGTTEQNIPQVDTMGNATGMKKGGKVKSMCSGGKAKKMATGGSVKASKMGSVKSSPKRDGIAIKGKTKGRVC